MKITTIYNKYNQNFTAVKLSKSDEIRARQLIDNIVSSEYSQSYIDAFVSELFGIFDKHILKESKLKIKGLHIAEDFIQEMYLKFFTTLRNLSSFTNPYDEVLNSINNFKPSKEVYKPETELLSLNQKFRNNEAIEHIDMITENDLPKYSRPLSKKENQHNIDRLNLALKATKLTQRQLEIFNLLIKGETQRNTANILGTSESNISSSKKKSIAKIQQANRVLPKCYKSFTTELKEKYGNNVSNKKITDTIINGGLNTIDRNLMFKRIRESSKILGITEPEFFRLGTIYPTIFHISTEFLKNNIKNLSEKIGITEEKCKSIILHYPSLCTCNPNTIVNNIIKSSELLGISKEQFKKCIIRHPPLLWQNPETLADNAEKSAQMIGITKDAFVKLCIKSPSLLSRRSDSLDKKIIEYVEVLNLTQEAILKLIMKAPSLLNQNPKTIYKNIQKSSAALEMTEEQFIKCTLKAPQLLYISTEILVRHAKESSQQLSMNKDDFLKCVMVNPTLILRDPNSLAYNLEKISELTGVSKLGVLESIKTNSNILAKSPESVYKKHQIIKYYKKLQNSAVENKLYYRPENAQTYYATMLSYLISKNYNTKIVTRLKPLENLTEYLKNNPDIKYILEIPEDEVTDEFVRFSKNLSEEISGKNMLEFIIIDPKQN